MFIKNLIWFGAIIIGALSIILSLFYYNICDSKVYFYKYLYSTPNNRIFNINELKYYNGKDRDELYLAILGNVFDVSLAPKYYGPGQSYHYFVGKDATRSFVSGVFEGPPREDIADFGKDDLRAILHWKKTYEEKYKQIGVLIGKYYNEQGELTSYGKEIQKLMDNAVEAKLEEDQKNKEFPPCNVEWNQESGTRVWCSKQSGGISRDWVGVPRQIYESGSKESRCACINSKKLSLKTLKEYEGCAPNSKSCYIRT